MSLTRKALTAMGIESDKIDQIIEMHTETVTALKEQIEEFKSEAGDSKTTKDELAKVQKELDELKKQAETDKKNSEAKATEFEKLKKEYDDYKTEQEAKAVRAVKEKALRELLTDMKMSDKGVAQVVKWMGVDNVEVDEGGKLKSAADLRKSIKEDWGDYIQTTEEKGASTPTPPANNGSGTGMTKAEILKIKDATERQKAISENPALFGLPTEGE